MRGASRSDRPMTVKVFISSSHKDDAERARLKTHLAPLGRRKGLDVWWDGDMLAGADINDEVRLALRRAKIFIALVSPAYLEPDYCFNKEYRRAMRRAARKTMHVVVAVMKPCHWTQTTMRRHKALPHDAKPVVQWTNRDQACVDIVAGITKVIAAVRTEERAKAAARPASAKAADEGGEAESAETSAASVASRTADVDEGREAGGPDEAAHRLEPKGEDGQAHGSSEAGPEGRAAEEGSLAGRRGGSSFKVSGSEAA